MNTNQGYAAHAALDLTQSAICSFDEKILYWSRGAAELFGRTEKEALGRTCHELLNDELPVPAAEIQEELLRKGRWHGNYKVERCDGSQFNVAADWVAFQDGPNSPMCVVKTFVEIPQWSGVDGLDNLTDGLLIMNSRFLLAYLNRAAERMLGEDRDSLIGRSIWELYPAAVGTQLYTKYQRAMRDRIKLEFEYRYEPWDRWFHIRVFPEQGGGISAVLRDITERMKTEESRQASDAALRTLTAGLFNSHDAERRGISNELHDRLNQELAALQLDLSLLTNLSHLGAEVLGQIQSVSQRVAELSDGLARIASQLHPSILDHLGLEVALRAYTTDFAARENLKCRFLTKQAPESLSPEMGICFYRILQEALENVARHGKTDRVVVNLSTEANEVCLSIRDYGRGFDVDATRDHGGLGLLHMEERMRLIHGRLTVLSQPGSGTVVEACAPLQVERRRNKIAVAHSNSV